MQVSKRAEKWLGNVAIGARDLGFIINGSVNVRYGQSEFLMLR